MNGRGRQDGRLGSHRRLFDPSELTLRPTGQARFRKLVARPGRSATSREQREDENLQTMARLRGWGRELADRFGLRFRSIDPERDGVTEHYGICYEDGVIRIRLRHARPGRLLKQSSLVDTLCHELAHLRHLDHSLRFRRLYGRILDEARRREIYRPGPDDDPRPRQLSLFGGGCGTGRSEG